MIQNHYRGITISSALGKLFNSVLKNRLSSYIDEHKLLNEEQIGFKSKCCTTDHMFILQCIIDKYRKDRKQLFMCFVDFSKAFDRIWHVGLFYNLQKIGVSNRFYNILKNMYIKIEIQVQIGNCLTPSFHSNIGLRQGDILSPSLFNIYINDIPRLLTECKPALYNGLPIGCLLYADDHVILSESEAGLQKKHE